MEESKGKGVATNTMQESKLKLAGTKRYSADKQIYTLKTPSGDLYEYMVHQRGDHWRLLIPYKAPIIKGDGFVIAIGDLPDELKTEDSLIVECPLPVMKYPRMLPVNITEREKIISKVHMEGAREFQANLNEAAKRPKMATISSKQPADAPPTTMNMLEMGAVKGKEKKRFEEEKKAVRQALVEQLKLLMSVYEELEKLELLSPISYPSLFSRYIFSPTFQSMEESKGKGVATNTMEESKCKLVGMKRYSAESNEGICTLETPSGELYEYMVHHRDNHLEVVPYKAPIIKVEGLAIAIGDIPDELNMENCLLIECPLPVMKYPERLPMNTDKRQQALNKIHMEGRQKFHANLSEAIKRAKIAKISSKQSEDAPPTTINILLKRKKQRSEEEGKVIRQTVDEQLKRLISVYVEVEKAYLARLSKAREQQMAQDAGREKPNPENNEAQEKSETHQVI
ncbi:hypothetical protein OROMI_016098 [Orobanche minor]